MSVLAGMLSKPMPEKPRPGATGAACTVLTRPLNVRPPAVTSAAAPTPPLTNWRRLVPTASMTSRIEGLADVFSDTSLVGWLLPFMRLSCRIRSRVVRRRPTEWSVARKPPGYFVSM